MAKLQTMLTEFGRQVVAPERQTVGGGGGPSGDAYLLESGDYWLLESGDYWLLE